MCMYVLAAQGLSGIVCLTLELLEPYIYIYIYTVYPRV